MEILSLSFALFVVKLAFSILPIAVGIRLFVLPVDQKIETSQKLSSKLLGDSNLIKQSVFDFGLYFIASLFILFGIIVALLLFL